MLANYCLLEPNLQELLVAHQVSVKRIHLFPLDCSWCLNLHNVLPVSQRTHEVSNTNLCNNGNDDMTH